jgi:hypothetical protein
MPFAEADVFNVAMDGLMRCGNQEVVQKATCLLVREFNDTLAMSRSLGALQVISSKHMASVFNSAAVFIDAELPLDADALRRWNESLQPRKAHLLEHIHVFLALNCHVAVCGRLVELSHLLDSSHKSQQQEPQGSSMQPHKSQQQEATEENASGTSSAVSCGSLDARRASSSASQPHQQHPLPGTVPLALEFLRNLVVNDANLSITDRQVQRSLMPFWDAFARFIPFSCALMCAILQDCPENLQQLSEAQVQLLCKATTAQDTSIVRVLKQMCMLEGRPFHKNQLIIMKCLIDERSTLAEVKMFPLVRLL